MVHGSTSLPGYERPLLTIDANWPARFASSPEEAWRLALELAASDHAAMREIDLRADRAHALLRQGLLSPDEAALFPVERADLMTRQVVSERLPWSEDQSCRPLTRTLTKPPESGRFLPRSQLDHSPIRTA